MDGTWTSFLLFSFFASHASPRLGKTWGRLGRDSGKTREVMGESWEVLGTLQNAFVALLRQTPPNPHGKRFWQGEPLGKGGVYIYIYIMNENDGSG